MKQIKRILSFLLILFLQLSIVNCFASDFSDDEISVDNFEFSKTGKPNSDFSEPDCKENYIFETSFLETVSCLSVSLCGSYPDLVEAWEVMHNAGVKDLANKLDEIVAVSDDISNVRKLGYENWLEDLDAVAIWTSRTDPNLRIMQKVDGESMSFYTRSTSNKQLDDLWQGSAEINDGWVELDFKVASDLQGQGIGTSMFNEAMAHFSKNSNINGVKGLWLNPSNYDDAISVNYSEFWDFYNKTAKTIENANEAALNIPTGKWVAQWANGKGINITPEVTILDGRVEVLFKVVD